MVLFLYFTRNAWRCTSGHRRWTQVSVGNGASAVLNYQAASLALTPLRPVFLPIYDWQEVATATRMLETAIERAVLDRFGSSGMSFKLWSHDDKLLDRWADQDLLLSQVTGHALASTLRDKVTPVLTPHYCVAGSSGSVCVDYLLVSRESKIRDLEGIRGGVAVVSRQERHFEMRAIQNVLGPSIDGSSCLSGILEADSSLDTMRSVIEGRANVCIVDAVNWAMANTYRPDVAGSLIAISVTRMIPGSPWVTSSQRPAAEVECIRDAAISVLGNPGFDQVREKLFLSGYSLLTVQDYLFDNEGAAELERAAEN